MSANDIAAILNQARILLRAGHAGEAAALLRTALAKDHGAVRAHVLLGMAQRSLGDVAGALASYEAALALDPNDAEALNSRGAALSGLKRFDEAVASYDAAIALQPGIAGLHLNRGAALLALGRAGEAADAFERALALDPGSADAKRGLDGATAALQDEGYRLLQAGDAERAAGVLRRATALAPDAWRSFSHLGSALRRIDPDGALDAYQRALAIHAADPSVHNNRGNVLLDLTRYAEAAEAFEAALALKPDYAIARTNLGRALFHLERHAEALAAFDAALEAAPDNAGAHAGRGDALMAMGRHAEAAEAYSASLAIRPDLPTSQHGLGRALVELDFLSPVTAETSQAALAAFDAAVAIAPDFAEGYWSRALTRLRLGRFADGWDDYDWRWEADSFVSRSAGLAQPALRARFGRGLTRQDLEGRRVLLVGEQGIGDMLMFASILPDLMAVAGPVALICERRLHRLFRASFPGLTLLGPDAEAPDADHVLPIGNLARIFRATEGSMPGTPYLTASPEARRAWAQKLGPQEGRFRIGVSWRGGLAFTGGAARSMTLEQLAPVLTQSGCEFINLQYGDVADDLARWNAAHETPVRPEPGDTNDFEDLAALVQNLDLVVSVQTAVVHLAGATGVPCFAMVPRKPEWRYGLSGPDMPWYRSVRLFRQGLDGEWGPVVDAVAREVARLRG